MRASLSNARLHQLEHAVEIFSAAKRIKIRPALLFALTASGKSMAAEHNGTWNCIHKEPLFQ